MADITKHDIIYLKYTKNISILPRCFFPWQLNLEHSSTDNSSWNFESVLKIQRFSAKIPFQSLLRTSWLKLKALVFSVYGGFNLITSDLRDSSWIGQWSNYRSSLLTIKVDFNNILCYWSEILFNSCKQCMALKSCTM